MRMDPNIPFGGSILKSVIQSYCPFIEDLFSFIVKILKENVSISSKNDKSVLECKICDSSSKSSMILKYHKNANDKETLSLNNNILLTNFLLDSKSSPLFSGAGSKQFNRMMKSKSLKKEDNVTPSPEQDCGEGIRERCRFNIVHDIFSIIVKILGGTASITTKHKQGSHEYTVIASSSKSTLILVYTDTVLEEKNLAHKDGKAVSEPLQQKDAKNLQALTPTNTKKDYFLPLIIEMTRNVESSLTESPRHEEKRTRKKIDPCLHCCEVSFLSKRKNVHGKKCRKKKSPNLKITKKHKKAKTSEKKLIHCQYCGKTFTRLTFAQEHERTHTGERPFKCSHCDKCFNTPGTVKRHERQHTGERPYKCRYCEKSFAEPGTAKKHERRHTGERPYKCKYCEKTFATRATTAEHERLHTGERPYKCQYCEKSFPQRGQVKHHERVHTGGKPLSNNTATESVG